MTPHRDYYLPQRRLVSQNDAAMIENARVPRSRFIGSWTRKMAFDAGFLVPFLVDEILPGDHMRYNVTAYLRMSTPLFPIFDNQRVDTFFFFVPNRLLWSNWQRFMGEQDNPTDSIDFIIPRIESPFGGSAVGSIYDHMGLPVFGQVDPGNSILFSALPFRAYNQIYNAWFRDQNITAAANKLTGDGPDVATAYVLRRRAKSHDYFTSALPWPQKFTPPTIPIAGEAPITGIGRTNKSPGPMATVGVWDSTHNNPVYALASRFWNPTPSANEELWVETVEGATPGEYFPNIFADLSQATGVAINTFRQAFLVQQLLERDARGGTRYTELIRSHFGVTNPDFRLQRPEYIGGGQTPLQITPVAQTAPFASGEGPSVVGALGAAGTAAGQHHASYAATEHGYIIGLINVRTELSYQQGLHKMWSRLTRHDFYWPSLAGLGEQAILRQEIFANGVSPGDTEVFGYQERWHEYRTRTSEVTGIMRSTAAGTLDAWHLAQVFATAPTLNTTFINDTPPMDRVLAAAELAVGQQYLADILINRQAVRPLPTFGTPVTLGRF